MGEDPYHPGAALDLLVQALQQTLQHVRALQRLLVGPGMTVKEQRLTDRALEPVRELGVFRRPLRQPRRQIAWGLREIPPVVQSAQLLKTVVISLAGQVIQRIVGGVDVAPLPGGIGQHLGEGFFEPRVIAGDDALDAAKTPVLQADVETPCTDISAKAATSAFSERG